ncbi:MAG: hypothetical protein HQM06_08215 [Magnetococcales bacterium]|nr:hypothetical protein [Magnetococcales bacterium]
MRNYRTSTVFCGAAGELRQNYGQAALQAECASLAPVEAQAAAELPPPNAPFVDWQLSDLGNMRIFIAQHGHRLKFNHQSGQWLIWQGTNWMADLTGEVEVFGKQTARSLLQIEPVGPWPERQKQLKFAVKSQNRRQIQDFVALARSEPQIAATASDFDRDNMLLNVRNGTLDLRNGKLRPHDRNDLITRTIPIVYDSKAACPTWLAFLAKVMASDQEMIDFLQKAVGYSLTGSTAEQAVFCPYGLGRNGKTVFMETVSSLLDGYAKRIPSESLMVRQNGGGIPNDLAMLAGARLAVASETQEGARLDESKLKEITGGDTITARFLHKEFFEFVPQFKLWIVGNHKPIIQGVDLGIWRRIRLVPFSVTIPPEEVDPQLPVKLRSELPGILTWAVRGCLAWQQAGLGLPAAVRAATVNYQNESDLLGQFLEERCRQIPGAESPVPAVYTGYRLWAEEAGLKPIAKASFTRKMSERGYLMRRSNGQTRIAGILMAA